MTEETNAIELATELTIAWLSNLNTRAEVSQVPLFLQSMHDAVNGLNQKPAEFASEPGEVYTAAVTARKSLARPDSIISMIDGKPYKTLRRHLAGHRLTPDEYRKRYNLKPEYPMTAPEYSEARRSMAKKIGLGRKPKAAEAPAPAPAEAAKTHEPKTQSRKRADMPVES